MTQKLNEYYNQKTINDLFEIRKKFPNNQEFGKEVASYLDGIFKNNLVMETAKTLKIYLGDILDEKDINPINASRHLESVFGKDIHYQINGLIQFANDKKYGGIDKNDIKITLAHDLGGALREDKLMLPRVTGYEKYSNLKK